MEKDLTLVVMAAGMGSRFGGLKQVQPVGPNGEFIIDYDIFDALRAGFNKVVFVIKEENYETFKNTVGSRIEDKVKVEYVFQKVEDIPEGFEVPTGRVKPWGTAHAIYSARNNVTGNFGIINSDDFYGKDAFAAVAEFFKNKDYHENINTYGTVGYQVGNTMTENGSVKRGILFTDELGNVDRTVECSVYTNKSDKIEAVALGTNEEIEVSYETPANVNLIACDVTFMEYLKSDIVRFFSNLDDPLNNEYFIPNVLVRSSKENHSVVKLINTTSKFYGITYKEDIDSLKEGIRKGIEIGDYKEDLWG